MKQTVTVSYKIEVRDLNRFTIKYFPNYGNLPKGVRCHYR